MTINNMTIEEIRTYLTEELAVGEEPTTKIIDSIVYIRSNAYAEGWSDHEAEG